MNDYSHQLYHNNQVNELASKAKRNRHAEQGVKNAQPTYKKVVANVGTALIHVGATLQDFSKFEPEAKYVKTN